MGRSHSALTAILLVVLVIGSGCISNGPLGGDHPAGGEGEVELTIWYTFDGKEADVFRQAIAQFEARNNISVVATYKPFFEAVDNYRTAAQGGEAPDLMRFSNDQLGEIAEVRVNGQPLLEDLRPFLTPVQRAMYDTRALDAMHYDGRLLALPASQDCLSLIYNKALFDAAGLDYPNAGWTTDDMLAAALILSDEGDDVAGIALPVKIAYWWFGFQAGYGGRLFAADGMPSLDSNGSAEALEFVLGLETEHGIVPTGTGVEQMKNRFLESKAAMIIDGPWNWANYQSARLDIGQTLLPTVSETGLRVAPMVAYKGYSLSTQTVHKTEAASLALWLTSAEVQREFALSTYVMPTSVELAEDADIIADPVIAGFLEQTQHGFPAPTTRAMSMVYDPLSTAIELVYAEQDGISAQDALSQAQAQLLEELA